ncbi:MAG: COQ9 family protein, partial [Alphaproteobacteria bacterium]|nr:COQ9 family protein [Alphaproteobacteria bacterium]
MNGTLDDSVHDLQARILDAAVRHAPFDGWGLEAWMRGASDVEIDDETARRLFPGGAGSMIALHSRLADTRMLASLEARDDWDSLRTRDRITAAVRERLEQAGPQREAVRRALAFLALPLNAGLGARLLCRSVDAMWIAAGDTSADFNFYTKRGILAGVYGSVVLYWLNDRSPDYEETWSFLDRRIANAMAAPKFLQTPCRILQRLP